MYILGDRPTTPSEAYDTLENVFGGDAFSGEDALETLVEVMNTSEQTAKTELNNLFRVGAIEEA